MEEAVLAETFRVYIWRYQTGGMSMSIFCSDERSDDASHLYGGYGTHDADGDLYDDLNRAIDAWLRVGPIGLVTNRYVELHG